MANLLEFLAQPLRRVAFCPAHAVPAARSGFVKDRAERLGGLLVRADFLYRQVPLASLHICKEVPA